MMEIQLADPIKAGKHCVYGGLLPPEFDSLIHKGNSQHNNPRDSLSTVCTGYTEHNSIFHYR